MLLERDAELSLIDALLDRAPSGDGALLAFAGPPGIGKTRLLAAAREHAERRGLAVLAARGSELERELGFGVVRQLFEPPLARALDRAELLAGAAALAEPLIDPGALPPGADPGFAALHGLYWLTVNLAARGPLLILVDDAHWADAPSLRFLAYLAGRLGGIPALVAIGTRLAEPGADTALVDALVADQRVVRPQPLSPASVGALVGERLGGPADAELVDACATATGGNPFLLVELLAALASDGLGSTRASAAHVRALGPDTVRRSVLARLARMGPDCTRLARAVAILGEHADLEHSAALAGLDPEPAARAADALAAAGVLRRERRPGFVHPMVRAAIYEDLLPHERASAHAVAARALAAAGAEPALVGAHLLHSPPGGDEWVVDVLRRAAASARAAPESAAAYLERALAEPPSRASRADVLRELGSAELRAGSALSFEHLGQAHRETEDPVVRAGLALELGRALLAAGRPDGAALIERAAKEVRDLDPGLAVRLEVEATGVERSLGVAPEARRARLRALRDEVEPGSAAQRLVLAGLAFEVATAGTSATEAAALAEEAFAAGKLLAEEGPESPNVIMAANSLIFCDRFDQARAILGAGLAAARAGGSAMGVAFCSCFSSHLSLRLGVVHEAEALARDAIALALAQPILEILRPIAVSFLVEALIERGDLAAAEDEVARSAGVRAGDLNAVFLVSTRGWLRVVHGAPERGLADLLEAGARLVETGVANAVPTFWRSRAALALLALGKRERAAALAAEEVDVARRFGAPSPIGVALHAAGLVAEGEQGRALLRESVAVLERSPARLDHARSLVALGGALRRGGCTTEAREPLSAGLALARTCGALALAERAYEELTATGARPRKILRTGVDALTATERRVAQMAADGMSNRDIAQALFVTVRTVETHLSHAYRKLAIGSRRELQAALDGYS